jgi:uncharacterized repeat protein (TIGR03803 family)
MKSQPAFRVSWPVVICTVIVHVVAVGNVCADVPVTILHSFLGEPSDGRGPLGGLTVVGSVLYGTTTYGNASGTAGIGTIFSINTNGTGYLVLHNFSPADGDTPWAGLTLVGSKLYGTTNVGGASGGGTIFSINTNGTGYQVLHNFSGGASDGANPAAGLTLVGATLYGTTSIGGASTSPFGFSGTLFSIDPSGSNYQLLYSFGAKGDYNSNPYGVLTFTGSTLYGTTVFGGAQGGTIFSISTNGTGIHVLNSFAAYDINGANPYAGLTLVGSTLYGTTKSGGASNYYGTIFSINTSGLGYQVLHSFSTTASDGTSPFAGLTLFGSTLYGTTDAGGTAGSGTIFSTNTSGTNYKVLRNFLGGTSDGASPYAGLTRVGLKLYGTTQGGGASGDGVIFSIPLPAVLGDFNLDGHLTNADIPAMLNALTDLNSYQTVNSLSDADMLAIGDVNHDDKVTNADIQALLDLIASIGGGSIATVHEPSTAILAALGLVFLVRKRSFLALRISPRLAGLRQV